MRAIGDPPGCIARAEDRMSLDAPTVPSPTPRRRDRRLLVRVAVGLAAVSLLLGAAGLAWLQGTPDPTHGLPAWDQLDTRWGTYLPERQWGTPHEATGGNGWGLDYLEAIRIPYRYGEDGIAGLTTRDGTFDIGWAAWDGKQSASPSGSSAGATRRGSTARPSSTGAPSARTRRPRATTATSSSTPPPRPASGSPSRAPAPTIGPASCGPRRRTRAPTPLRSTSS